MLLLREVRMAQINWKKTAWGGWAAYHHGQQIQIRKYYTPDIKRPVYVARPAEQSPAVGYLSLSEAKRRVVEFVEKNWDEHGKVRR
jgi:hypothetical protein